MNPAKIFKKRANTHCIHSLSYNGSDMYIGNEEIVVRNKAVDRIKVRISAIGLDHYFDY